RQDRAKGSRRISIEARRNFGISVFRRFSFSNAVNWEAINAIAQAIGAFGVVASLWYLGIQVHRSTRVAKIAAQDSAATALREVTKPYMENAELARIWQVGLENLNALTPADQSRFF